ncbi:MAG: hypothetical protein AAGN66_17845 [Acidobacteriota bacterium]
MPVESLVVYYPGNHGPEITTTSGTPGRGYRFKAKEARTLPAADAHHLLRAGWILCQPLAEIAERRGLTQKAIKPRAQFVEHDTRKLVLVTPELVRALAAQKETSE